MTPSFLQIFPFFPCPKETCSSAQSVHLEIFSQPPSVLILKSIVIHLFRPCASCNYVFFSLRSWFAPQHRNFFPLSSLFFAMLMPKVGRFPLFPRVFRVIAYVLQVISLFLLHFFPMVRLSGRTIEYFPFYSLIFPLQFFAPPPGLPRESGPPSSELRGRIFS